MKLNTCKPSPEKHKEKVYTLKDLCPLCNSKTESAHYKFLNLKDVKDSLN